MAEAPFALARDSDASKFCARLLELSEKHACSNHALFGYLERSELSNNQAAALLRNYDAHASVLRRLLLNAASIMPEAVVPFVLENVRNEYGNGNYALNHQAQLRDLSRSCGISSQQFMSAKIQPGIREFIKEATRFYKPGHGKPKGLQSAGITAGAITATELLAIKEFASLQKAFARRGLQHHIWFHHVSIEVEHSDESLALAMYFSSSLEGLKAVEYGLSGILDANIKLYDGLFSAIQSS